MKQQKHSGAAHLIIVVILVLGLVGSLGYIVWDKVINKEQDTSNVQEDTNTSNGDEDQGVADEEIDPYEGWKTVTETASGENLSLKYPSDWEAKNTTAKNPDGSQNSTIEIISPDRSFTVELIAALSGIGGACPLDDPTYKIYQINEYRLNNYPGYSFYSGIVHWSDSDTYRYIGSVIKSNENIKVGNSACYFGLNIFTPPSNDEALIMLHLTPNNVVEDKFGYQKPNDINDALASSDYQTAIKIIQSLYFK